MSLLPEFAFLVPALTAFLVYGVRYAFFASIAFFLSDPSRPRPLGRPHIQRPPDFQLRLHLKREMLQSFLTLLVFAGVNGVLFGYGLIEYSRIYFKLSDFPLWWFVASIPALLLLHDTLFYWSHRAMHSRHLFRWVHRKHHESVYPTAFGGYSFSVLEALAQALIAVALIFILPVHPLAFLVFQTLSTAFNIYGHCGRELFPAGMAHHPVGRWINTSTHHAHHHRHVKGNYGFYFTFWDRAMGTLRSPDASPTPRQVARLTGGV